MLERNAIFLSVFSFYFAIKMLVKSDFPITLKSAFSDITIIEAFQGFFVVNAVSPND